MDYKQLFSLKGVKKLSISSIGSSSMNAVMQASQNQQHQVQEQSKEQKEQVRNEAQQVQKSSEKVEVKKEKQEVKAENRQELGKKQARNNDALMKQLNAQAMQHPAYHQVQKQQEPQKQVEDSKEVLKQITAKVQ
jgi:hypothetical protein